jgi:hypothetical protein
MVYEPPPSYRPVPNTNKHALASLITGALGLAGLVLSCVLPFCIPIGPIWFGGLGIAAVVTGVMGRRGVARSQGSEAGEGIATAGLIMGAVNIGLAVLFTVLIILGVIALAVFGNLISPTPIPNL